MSATRAPHLGTYGRVQAVPRAPLNVGNAVNLKSSLSRAEKQQQNNPAAQKRKARKGDFKDLSNAACMGRYDDVLRVLNECRQQSAGSRGVQAALNNKELSGMTPLMYASGFGHLEVVALLCEYGADINSVDDKYGMTALHQVKKNSSVGPCPTPTTPVQASSNNYPEVVEFLLEHGADPTIKERYTLFLCSYFSLIDLTLFYQLLF
jgi:hypothetical protein